MAEHWKTRSREHHGPKVLRSTMIQKWSLRLVQSKFALMCCITEPFMRSMAEGISVHSDGIKEVHQVPMNVINRPIPSVLEEEKVQSLMKTIQVRVF